MATYGTICTNGYDGDLSVTMAIHQQSNADNGSNGAISDKYDL
jgi:hypothetical protein